MSHPQNDDLARARDALTIFRVWEVAALEGAIMTPEAPPRRDGLVKSPFRDDGRNGSFSICHGGKGFKDFGTGGAKGDVWRFAELCWPNLQKGEIAKKLIEISGITPTPRPARNDAQPGAAAAPVDPTVARAAKAIAKRDRVRAMEEKIYEDLEEQYKPRAEVKDVPEWPQFVADRWAEGSRVLRGAVARISELARERGWPAEWALELVTSDMLSYPLERWIDKEDAKHRRQKAFRVDLPIIKTMTTADGNDAIATATLRPVGYHQRWFVPPKDGQPASKGWLYIPSVPKSVQSKFDQALTAYGETLGVTPENRHGLFPPLPFVLGDLAGPKVIVLLEGQWDAITFFGACGYFEDANPPQGIAVFGIRGAQGLDVFLAYWAKWLRYNEPIAWVIADNDAAGQTWLKPPEADPGLPRGPSFAERLERMGCRKVLTSWLKPGAWGKDFNDYYKAAKPSTAKMAAWMQRVGVMKENGQWA